MSEGKRSGRGRKPQDLSKEPPFGRLTAIRRVENLVWGGQQKTAWLCRCECGTKLVVAAQKLRSGDTQSCGCYQKDRTAEATGEDLTCQRFGRLTAVWLSRERRSNGRFWDCVCDCREDCLVSIAATHLASGDTLSCGCYRNDRIRETAHKHAKHGKWKTPEFNVWQSMKQRCLNPKHRAYPRYGGRGITVDPRWLGENGFANFLADVGQRPSPNHELDRFPDNNGPYTKSNVRWATRKENNRNKRNNRTMTWWGITKTVPEWAEIFKVKRAALYRMLDPQKWDARKAVREAVASGVLVKPPHCEHPGCTNPKTQGHHVAGYARDSWLTVQWLCSRHHAQAEPSRRLD